MSTRTEWVDDELYTYTPKITVELIQAVGGDHMVVAAAKVSTSGDDARKYATTECSEDNFGLINYLMKHRHGSPFEHGLLTFFVHAPIFVWREWHRHRVGFSYNEQSARYTTLSPVFYIPDYHRPMVKVDNWKPGRPKFLRLEDTGTDYFSSSAKHEEIVQTMMDGYRREYQRYLTLLKMGIDPGLARDNLPVGIYSSCWVTCNPRSMMHFLSLRTHEPTADRVSYPLYEIEVAARKCEELFAQQYPLTHRAFVENGRTAP